MKLLYARVWLLMTSILLNNNCARIKYCPFIIYLLCVNNAVSIITTLSELKVLVQFLMSF